MKQEITFTKEKDNQHDRFAVVGKTILPGMLFPATVGHIPIELSRYVWFSLKRRANIMGQVKSIKYKRSPLVQGGLEIPVEVTIHWEDELAFEILKRKPKK